MLFEKLSTARYRCDKSAENGASGRNHRRFDRVLAKDLLKWEG